MKDPGGSGGGPSLLKDPGVAGNHIDKNPAVLG